MGFLRLTLALMICVMHAKAEAMIPSSFLRYLTGLSFDPKLSVFFMMAGFFARQAVISLRRRHVKWWPLVFYRSRMLRLWPVYWVCVFATYISITHFHTPVMAERMMPNESLVAFWIYNLIPIIPSSFKIGTLIEPSNSVIYVLMVFQAWTMALITALFILTPILLYGRVTYWLFLASCVGLYHAYVLQRMHQGYVIIAMPYFLAGAMAFDLYAKMAKAGRVLKAWEKGLCLATVALLMAMLLSYTYLMWVWGAYIAHGTVVVISWLLLPYIFLLTRYNRFDQWASNLAYPLYLSHFLIFSLIRASPLSRVYYPYITIPLCLLVAAALHLLLERPFMRYRRRGDFVPGSSLSPP